eukprot:m.164670 g.164670  ORF g.164670 m.164670 type:complete len:322 (-) comp12454_c0_seq1:180-1145(-)
MMMRTLGPLAALVATASAATYTGALFSSAESKYIVTNDRLIMQPANPLGASEYYTVDLVPKRFVVTNGGPSTDSTQPWTQQSCGQGALYLEDCDHTNVEKRVTWTRPVTPSGTANLTLVLRILSADQTTTLPNGGTFTTPAGHLKADIIIEFPKGSSATDSLITIFNTNYQVPTTLSEVLDANVGVTNIQSFDGVQIDKDVNGCTESIFVDAIFKLDVDFAVSYDANGVAQTVCADANDDFDARLVNITLDWQDIGLPAGSNVQLTLDPSFFIDNGKLAGGFNVMWLIVVVVLLFVCICCCCVLCIAKCCGCCCFSDDKSA